jgi:hypothetical protein
MTSPLRRIYGEVILKRGSVLYHTSDKPFHQTNDVPMLFLTFHPSDWDTGKYITKFTLIKDVTLFFMVERIHNFRVYPLLDTLIDAPGRNLDKMYFRNQVCYGQNLLVGGFDGWFSTIKGGPSIEVGLLNLGDVWSYKPSTLLRRDWKDVYTNTKGRWGIIYPINVSAVFRIHHRYKEDIDAYLYNTNSVSPDIYTLQHLLSRSPITYHDYPFQKITWRC